MAVPATVQMAISKQYATLANAVTHDPSSEKKILAPHFADRAHLKLSVYEYDPLTVLVLHISRRGRHLVVRAEYVGVSGKHETTLDRWLLLHGAWRLTQRNEARP